MKHFYSLLILSAALLLSVNADCAAQISIQARVGGSYQVGGVPHQIYDITAANTGSETITSLFGFFGYPSGNNIVQAWNYAGSSGEISGFAGDLLPGQSYTGAGFILAGTGSPALAFTTPKCPSTPVPTDAPTEAPTPAPGSCAAQLALKKRESWGSFLENGIPSQIWDLVFTNTGSLAISSLTITITPAAGTSVNQNNKWNLQYSSESDTYSVDHFSSLYEAGTEFHGAGFVIAGETTEAPAAAIASVAC